MLLQHSCCGVRLGGRAYIASGELNSLLTTKLTNIRRIWISRLRMSLRDFVAVVYGWDSDIQGGEDP